MKFDYVIGNPPYQDETLGDNKGFAPPVYNFFLDEAFKISNCVELIHPARFLFNAGSTPKEWNEKMLNNEHYKVLFYESCSANVFSNTDIKGGVAITFYNHNANYGKIGIFTPYPIMNNILKTILKAEKQFISDISISGYAYHFTDVMHDENPDVRQYQSKGHEYDLKSNIIEKLPMIFLDNVEGNADDYIEIVGRANNERVTKFILKKYVNEVKNLYNYKLLMPKASGIGAFGETLGAPIIASPGVGHTETFFSIGCFNSEDETNNLHKYIKTKFARSLLSVLKTTQNITPGNWKYVPLQDFTSASDIDWSKSIAEIDRQLYKKYGLSEDEIDFIETHVKEMT